MTSLSAACAGVTYDSTGGGSWAPAAISAPHDPERGRRAEQDGGTDGREEGGKKEERRVEERRLERIWDVSVLVCLIERLIN